MSRRLLYIAIIALVGVFSAGSLAAQGSLTFSEDFSRGGEGWTKRDRPDVKAEVKEGKYRFGHTLGNSSYLYVSDQASIDGNQNYKVEATVRLIEDSLDAEHGIVWGCADASNFQGFVIRPDGRFTVFQYKNGKRIVLARDRALPNMIHPAGRYNTLTARQEGGQLSVYVNDLFLWTGSAVKMFGSRAGFMMSGTGEAEALRFSIWHEKPLPMADRLSLDAGDWRGAKRDSLHVHNVDDALVLRSEVPGRPDMFLRDISPEEGRDFIISAEFELLRGKMSRGYGLVWGADSSNAFAFGVNSFGSWHVYRMENSKPVIIRSWEPTEGVVEPGKPIRLGLKKSGDALSFYVNDVFVWEGDSPIAYDNGLGFVLEDTLTLAIRKFEVRQGKATVQQPPPALAWHQPERMVSLVAEPDFDLRAGITSSAGIESIKIYVNGTEVSSAPAGGVRRLELERTLPLDEGENEIMIVVAAPGGAATMESRRVTYQPKEEAVSRVGKDYALFFATDLYDEWTDLVNPVQDARAIARELEENYGFIVEVVENAERSVILSKLKEYARREYAPDDQLMVFFAGHGKFDQAFGEGYVVCTDSRKSDDGNESYIGHSSMRTIINNMGCKHIFLAMDVCFGGTIDPFIARSPSRGEMDDQDGDGNKEFIARKMKFRTRRYLTSGGKEYVPDGTPGQHSPFARKMLEALRNYGGSDRIITLNELMLYFDRLTPEPRSGEFGSNEPGSDFLFIAR